MRKLKLIWDFFGPHAHKTAQHHAIHLKDYIKLEELTVHSTGFQAYSDSHSIAYLVIDENLMIPIRDALKPNRGEVFL